MESRKKLDMREIIEEQDVNYRRTYHKDNENRLVPVVFCSFKGVEVKMSGLDDYRTLELKALRKLRHRIRGIYFHVLSREPKNVR